jgi:predicted restriction endonuclease
MIHHPANERCPRCPPKRGSDSAARKAQAQFREAILGASDGRCAYYDANFVRCPETENLEAAHIGPRYADSGKFELGAMLCPPHHRLHEHGD